MIPKPNDIVWYKSPGGDVKIGSVQFVEMKSREVDIIFGRSSGRGNNMIDFGIKFDNIISVESRAISESDRIKELEKIIRSLKEQIDDANRKEGYYVLIREDGNDERTAYWNGTYFQESKTRITKVFGYTNQTVTPLWFN